MKWIWGFCIEESELEDKEGKQGWRSGRDGREFISYFARGDVGFSSGIGVSITAFRIY